MASHPPPTPRRAEVGQIAVQVLTAHCEHHGTERQRDRNGAAHREHREPIVGVRAHEVAPAQRSQPPEPVRAAGVRDLVSTHPHHEGECERDHRQAPGLAQVASQLAGHRSSTRERPTAHADRSGQRPGPGDRQLRNAPGLPGQNASDSCRQAADSRPDHHHRDRMRNHPAGTDGPQDLDEPLILVPPQHPAGQHDRHERGAHEQKGPGLPLQELPEPARSRDVSVEQTRPRRLAHLLDEYRPGLQ